MSNNSPVFTTELFEYNRKMIQLLIEKKQSINYYWTSSTKLYNYMNDEPLLDWLNMYGKRRGFKKDIEIEYDNYLSSRDKNDKLLEFYEFVEMNNRFDFYEYILKQGFKYEKYVVDTLKHNFKENLVDISDYNFGQFEYDKKLEITKKLIDKQIPIICQGFVCDPDTKTFGFPDLIVREDYIEKLFSGNIDQENTRDHKQIYNYHIVDIKYHTLDYKKNSLNIIPNPSQKQYVSQLYLYTKGLRHLIPVSLLSNSPSNNSAFVIGRNWNLENTNNSIGKIHFDQYEDIIFKMKNGLEWFKELRNNGYNWNPFNPTRYEMYPNMKNDKDSKWKLTKQQIAEKLKEITMIWNCGNNLKQKLFNDGIYSWDSPKFVVSHYFNNDKLSSNIQSIININKNDIKLFDYDYTFISDKKWNSTQGFDLLINKNNTIVMDGFIDIETSLDIKSIDEKKEDSLTFMIGLYYNSIPMTQRKKTYKTNMSQKTFCVDSLNQINEKKNLKDFLIFLKNYSCETHIIWRLYHFSSIEKYTLTKLMEKYDIFPETFGITFEWIDLCEILISYKFVFKGYFDYSLKTINKALHNIGYIPDNCIYKNSLIKNGMDTIVATLKCNSDSIENKISLSKIPLMDEIIYYNTIDCMSLYHIRDFLQKNL